MVVLRNYSRPGITTSGLGKGAFFVAYDAFLLAIQPRPSPSAKIVESQQGTSFSSSLKGETATPYENSKQGNAWRCIHYSLHKHFVNLSCTAAGFGSLTLSIASNLSGESDQLVSLRSASPFILLLIIASTQGARICIKGCLCQRSFGFA